MGLVYKRELGKNFKFYKLKKDKLISKKIFSTNQTIKKDYYLWMIFLLENILIEILVLVKI